MTVVEVEEALVGWLRDGTVPHAPAYDAARPIPCEVQLQGRDERYWLYLARRSGQPHR